MHSSELNCVFVIIVCCLQPNPSNRPNRRARLTAWQGSLSRRLPGPLTAHPGADIPQFLRVRPLLYSSLMAHRNPHAVYERARKTRPDVADSESRGFELAPTTSGPFCRLYFVNSACIFPCGLVYQILCAPQAPTMSHLRHSQATLLLLRLRLFFQPRKTQSGFGVNSLE